MNTTHDAVADFVPQLRNAQREREHVSRWSFGNVLPIGAMTVTTALVVLALGGAHGWEPGESWEWLFVVIPAIGLASTATLGGAYAASTAFAHEDRRNLLLILWTLILAGLIYLISAYLVAHYPDDGPLREVLGDGWGLRVYMASIVTIPELAVVAALVSADVRLQAAKRARAEAEESDLERIAIERSQAEARVRELEAKVAALHRQLDEAERGSGDRPMTIPDLAFDVLRDHRGWMTVSDVATEIEAQHGRTVKTGSMRNALNGLADSGRVQRAPSTQEGRPVNIYGSARPGEVLPDPPTEVREA